MSIVTETLDQATTEHATTAQGFPAVPHLAGGHEPHERRRRDHAPDSVGSDDGFEQDQPMLAMFCFEPPDSIVGQFAASLSAAVASRNVQVHIFSREPIEASSPRVHVHAVGACPGLDLLGEVNEFTRRAANAYLRLFHGSSAPIMLMGHEWSAVPAISLLHGIKNLGVLFSLHSLERQRSGMADEFARRIEEIEIVGLRESKAIFVQDSATAEVARRCVPDCAHRLIDASPIVPPTYFENVVDPGQVKAKYQIGPIDPTLLYVGDLSDRYGPDLLVKAMPAVLRKHPQARCVIVGDGDLYWQLRVYSRYLLLDYAVRMTGHMEGPPLQELVQAADMIVIPNRDSTPWWPVLAAWAAERPVVATYASAAPLLVHEADSLLVDPTEYDLPAGIVRLLDEPDFARQLAGRGREKLEERCNWNALAMQIEEIMRVQSLRGARTELVEV